VKQKISIVESIVVILVFLLASGSMESYNQVFAYKGVHRGHHAYHEHRGYHGYTHHGQYGSSPIGHHPAGRGGPNNWHPSSPIFCHPGNPIICHPSTPVISHTVSPIISHLGGGNVGGGSPISPSGQGDPGGSGFQGGPVGIPRF